MENLFIEAIARSLGWEAEDIREVRMVRREGEWRISVLKAPKSSMIYVTVQKGTLEMPDAQ